MMRGIRNLLWLIPLVLMLGWPLYGVALRDFLTPPEVPKQKKAAARKSEQAQQQQQRFVMEEVRLYQDQEGARQLRLDTPSLRTGEESNELLLATINAVMFREGQEHLFIVADHGRYDIDEEIIYLIDNVELREIEGPKMLTPALSYYQKEGRVSSRAGVEVSTNEIRVRGKNFDYDLKTGRYLLSGKVNFITR